MARRVISMSEKTKQNQEQEKETIYKDCKLWINLGTTIKLGVPNEDKDGTFISLPLGIPLGNLKEFTVTDEDLATKDGQIKTARNSLLRKVLKKISNLKSGEEVFINGLEIQILKTKDKEQNGSNNFNVNEIESQLNKVLGLE